MKKLIVLVLLFLAVPVSAGRLTEVCGAGFIDENGCVAKMCQQCSNGKCYAPYVVIVHCPGDPPLLNHTN